MDSKITNLQHCTRG